MKQLTIIKKPVITERSLKDASHGIYTFAVETNASKYEIKKAIERLYNVHIVRLATVTVKGKERIVGRKRNLVKRPDWKKARVRVKEGEKISVFEVGQS